MSKKFFKCSAHSNRDDDDAGCLSTFIDIFDFRVKNSHQLLSQRMSGCDKHLESEHSRRKLDFPSALDIILDHSNGSFHKDNELSMKDHTEDEMPKTIALQKNLKIVAKILKKQKHVNQELIFGKECQSKELMEALQALSLKKELILKLIQDPSSITLKQIQDIRDDISENFQHKSTVIHLQQNDSYIKIPSYSPLSHHIIENGEGEKTKSSFSFKAIRRKLSRAISKSKKEKCLISMDAVLDKIPYGYKDASCLSENNILSPRFCPLRQNISDVRTQSSKETMETAGYESFEEHYNLDVNTELVHDTSQKNEDVTDFMVSEPVESEAKAQISVPLVSSHEHIQVEKLEFTEEGNVHTSPVSVLEPYFLDDATSPKSQKTDNVVCTILPHKIDFHDQGNAETTSISSDFESTSTRNKKATYGFITELLQASSNSYDHFIDQALFEETRIVHGITVDDSKLYIDCLNEVIKEIKTRLSCFSSCVPIKPNFSHQYYIEAVCKGIERYLQLSQCTLYEMDMKEMTDLTWVSHKSEIVDIVIEVADGILEEMIMQIMLKKQADESYMLYIINDTVDYS